MVDSAIPLDEDKREFFDPPELLDEKIELLADMIKRSKHMIAFTGAGISTSAGIQDYRSGMNTVLKTGPGEWELQANKVNSPDTKYQRKGMLEALPTATHMSFVALEKAGILKCLVSQNIDGLHRRSGVSPAILAELHGNYNLEVCKKCNKKYLRDFKTRTAKRDTDHLTSRFCDDPSCKSPLYDSIINFGERLPEEEVKLGFEQAELADLCLAMGSSLRVTPAADIPAKVGRRKKNLVIINLQKTGLDDLAIMTIYGMCDDIMKKLMEKLKITVPEFKIIRRVGIKKIPKENKILLRGLDADLAPYSIFSAVEVSIQKKTLSLNKEPFEFSLSEAELSSNTTAVDVNLKFHGHYGETDCKMKVDLKNLSEEEKVFLLTFDLKLKKWSIA